MIQQQLSPSIFGNFTAYFKVLPPTVPAEYIASLFTVVVTAIVGSLLIPYAISWFKSRKQTSRLNSFHQQMATIYADGKVDENDTDKLDKLNKNISDSYAAGKITNDQYTNSTDPRQKLKFLQHTKKSLRKELNLSLPQILKMSTT
jgi:hypothetical protein